MTSDSRRSNRGCNARTRGLGPGTRVETATKRSTIHAALRGPGAGPRVSVFDGKDLVAGSKTRRDDFFAGSDSNRGGVRVAVKDLDDDGVVDLLAAPGRGAGSRVTSYSGVEMLSGRPEPRLNFDAEPGFAGGVFVG